MKILVIGGGGREHALIWRLSRDSERHELFCAPGNAGTASLATNVPIGAADVDDLVAWAQLARPDLVVVGPAAPLCLGVADRIGALGIPVFGPREAAARMEGSKAFAKWAESEGRKVVGQTRLETHSYISGVCACGAKQADNAYIVSGSQKII